MLSTSLSSGARRTGAPGSASTSPQRQQHVGLRVQAVQTAGVRPEEATRPGPNKPPRALTSLLNTVFQAWEGSRAPARTVEQLEEEARRLACEVRASPLPGASQASRAGQGAWRGGRTAAR